MPQEGEQQGNQGGDNNQLRQQQEGNQGGDNNQLRQQQQQPRQPPPHRQCPRCHSDNTKFCYYNNYSFLQPRYFCKSCKRYWTHGGTLRNVPVGGGSRRGKRARPSNSGDNSQAQAQPQQPQQGQNTQVQAIEQNMIPAATSVEHGTIMAAGDAPSMARSSYYQGDAGGYLSASSFAGLNQTQTFNSLINPTPTPTLTLGGGPPASDLGIGSSSNLALLHGFSIPQMQPTQFYQMVNRAKSMRAMYSSAAPQGLFPAASVPQHDWHQGFINNANPAGWSMSTSTTAGPSTSSLDAVTQWPDVPGFGPH